MLKTITAKLLKILSIDPSGTGTTGICLIWGTTKLFFEYKSKKWQEHYKYILNLVKNEKPNLILIETAYYEASHGSKDIMDLGKLVGALECLKFHCQSQIIMCQNNITKDWGKKIKQEIKTIPNLFYQDKKWIYYEEGEEIAGRTKEKSSRMNKGNGRNDSAKIPEKIQEISQHQADAFIIWHVYSKTYPYLG